MRIRHATLTDVMEQCGRLARDGERMRPDGQMLAAFDADGTLWGNDVGDLLWDHLVAHKALAPAAALPLARIVLANGGSPSRDPYADYATIRAMRDTGAVPQETLVRAMLQGLAGLTTDDITRHAGLAVGGTPEIASAGSGAAARIIESLRKLKYRVVVVSASPRWAVESAAAPLGIHADDILAGQVSTTNGRLTDGIIEPLPWGKGKVQAILRRFGVVPCVSMGNSLGDLAMLEATSHLRLLISPKEDLLAACGEIRGELWSLTRAGSDSEGHATPDSASRRARQPGASH